MEDDCPVTIEIRSAEGPWPSGWSPAPFSSVHTWPRWNACNEFAMDDISGLSKQSADDFRHRFAVIGTAMYVVRNVSSRGSKFRRFRCYSENFVTRRLFFTGYECSLLLHCENVNFHPANVAFDWIRTRGHPLFHRSVNDRCFHTRHLARFVHSRLRYID